MTVYELISLQVPFEKLCKINPDANVNVCVTKSKRPTLPIKVIGRRHCNINSEERVQLAPFRT